MPLSNLTCTHIHVRNLSSLQLRQTVKWGAYRQRTEVSYIQSHQNQPQGRWIWGGAQRLFAWRWWRREKARVMSAVSPLVQRLRVKCSITWIYGRSITGITPTVVLLLSWPRPGPSHLVRLHPFRRDAICALSTPTPTPTLPSHITLASWTNGLCPLLMTLLYHCSGWKPLWRATKLPESLWVWTIYVLHSLFLLFAIPESLRRFFFFF